MPFLLSAAAGGTVIAEREIGAKTNEIPEIGPMLLALTARFPLAAGLTADALHTQRKLADLICEQLLAHYVLTVKDNQKNLHAALAALNWDRARRHVTRDRATAAPRPAAAASRTPPPDPRHVPARPPGRPHHPDRHPHRHRPRRPAADRTQKTSSETVYVVTSLSAREAAPAHIAAYVRGHWAIESKVHWVRDVTFAEDACKVRAGSAPASWPPCVTSPSASSARPGTPASPAPSAPSNTTLPCSWPSSASPRTHDQHKQLCPTPWP